MKIKKLFSTNYDVMDARAIAALSYLRSLPREKIADAESLSELEGALSFERIRKILLLCYAAAPENGEGKEETPPVVVSGAWTYLPAQKQRILQMKDDTFLVLEKHKVEDWYVCLRNIVSTKDEECVAEAMRLTVDTVYPKGTPLSIKEASAMARIVPLEDADKIFFTEDSGAADLWIQFQMS